MTDPIKERRIRYTNFSLPDFRYIPKLHKNHGKSEELAEILEQKSPIVEFSEMTWQKSLIYLYAIDLFNYGYYWEVHEFLELIWNKKGKKSPIGIFIQGIIQISVALLKMQQLNLNGLKLLTAKALPNITSQSGIYLGINIGKFVEQINAFVNGESKTPPFIELRFSND